jgi:putative copper export protein
VESPPDLLFLVVRIAGFILLLSAAGTAIFVALFGGRLHRALAPITRLGLRFTIAAAVARIAQQAIEAARMSGEMSGIFDPAMQAMALRSPGGGCFALALLGIVLLACSAQTRFRIVGPLGALLGAVAFALTGHTAVNTHSLAAGVLLTLHVLIVAFWIGSLWPLYIAAGEEDAAVSGQLIESFSAVAVWAVPGILLAGVGMTALLVPGLAVFSQPYGRLLLGKVALFAVLLAIATCNKYWLGPACAGGDPKPFQRTVATEYLIICGVLAVTAVMTTFFSPEAP